MNTPAGAAALAAAGYQLPQPSPPPQPVVAEQILADPRVQQYLAQLAQPQPPAAPAAPGPAGAPGALNPPFGAPAAAPDPQAAAQAALVAQQQAQTVEFLQRLQAAQGAPMDLSRLTDDQFMAWYDHQMQTSPETDTVDAFTGSSA